MKHTLIGAALAAAVVAAPHIAIAAEARNETPAPEATGGPDGATGNRVPNWTPATASSGIEWLRLSYDYSICAASILVHYGDTASSLTGLEVNGDFFARADLKEVNTVTAGGKQTVEFLLPKEIVVYEVTLVFDLEKAGVTPSIDAVGAVNLRGDVVWASEAVASTSAATASLL